MGGGWAIFFEGPRGPGRRVRGRGGAFCVLGVSLALWAASAWALTALILCQTLCRLRGRCGTARARAALWDAVGRRARSRWEAWTPSFSVIGLVCLWWCEASMTWGSRPFVRALRTHNAMRGVILGPMERLHREPVLGPSHQAELITASLFHLQAQRSRCAQTCKASERAFFIVTTALCEGDCITCSHRDNSCIH